MKITKQQLQNIIKEEMKKFLKEEDYDVARDRRLGGLRSRGALEAGWEDGSTGSDPDSKLAKNDEYMDAYKMGRKEFDSYGSPVAEGAKEEMAARIRAHQAAQGEEAGSRATGTPKPEDSVKAALGAVDKEYRRFAPDDLESIGAFEDGLRSMIDRWRSERGETPSSMMTGEERMAAINRHLDRMEKSENI